MQKLSESKTFVMNEVHNFISSEKEKYDIQGVSKNGSDLLIVFKTPKSEEEMEKKSQEISNDIMVHLSKFIKEKIANLPILRFSVLNPTSLKLEL
jgi:hypothetical protein